MSDDFNAQLASHEDLIRHLVALVTKMDTVIDALREDHRLIVQLLQRSQGDDHRNGGSHA
jgi:uncharacterized coiled-coil protein SlyX